MTDAGLNKMKPEKFTLDHAKQQGKPIKIVNYITNEITKI